MLPRSLALVLAVAAALLPSTLHAHPISRKSHDRIIQVRLTPDAVIVQYRLELDEWTAIMDLKAVLGDDYVIPSPRRFYRDFIHAYAPLLAQNLDARLDKHELEFTCIKEDHRKVEHLRCDYTFRAPWKPKPGARHEFTFRERNYELETARLDVSLTSEFPVFLLEKSEPDKALKERPLTELRPGDEARLRKASAAFTVMPSWLAVPISEGASLWNGIAGTVTPLGKEPARDTETAAPPSSESLPNPAPAADPPATIQKGLLELLFTSELGFWALIGLAAAFGAAHALTPGHGKTLVAAYLVGQRGTAWHALGLGLIVTLTHTGVVILIAGMLRIFANELDAEVVMFALGFGSSVFIVCFGAWLLLRRLSGGADHFHIGGHGHHHHGDDHGHHHHYGPGDHYHDEDGQVHSLPQEAVGWWGLFALGIVGGMVPCVDAILMLMFAVSAGKLGLALPLLLAFSAGLASVLVVIGILVVRVKGFAESRWGSGKFIRALPVASAVVIIVLGLGLGYKSLHPEPPRSAASVATRP